jgi:hypothetical protein
MQEIRQSWAMVPASPYDVYMKALYSLVRDRIEGDDSKDILWDDEISLSTSNAPITPVH